jgi:hypothetical protein
MGLIEKLKLLFKARQPVTDIINQVKEAKSGWKTWQFWATLVGSLGGLIVALKGFIPLEWSLILTTALTFLYNVLRGATKADVTGVKPLLQSSEFWISLLGYAQNALLALQTGGIDPKWVMESSAFITAGLGMAQNLAAQQPSSKTATDPTAK